MYEDDDRWCEYISFRLQFIYPTSDSCSLPPFLCHRWPHDGSLLLRCFGLPEPASFSQACQLTDIHVHRNCQ
jgi:hypothetical protein